MSFIGMAELPLLTHTPFLEPPAEAETASSHSSQTKYSSRSVGISGVQNPTFCFALSSPADFRQALAFHNTCRRHISRQQNLVHLASWKGPNQTPETGNAPAMKSRVSITETCRPDAHSYRKVQQCPQRPCSRRCNICFPAATGSCRQGAHTSACV